MNTPVHKCEVLSDADDGLINLLYQIQTKCTELQQRLRCLKYCKEDFEYAELHYPTITPWTMARAVYFFVINRMSRGGLGNAFSWQNRQRGGQPGSINEWENAIANLSTVSERLQNVFIFQKDFREVIQNMNSKDTFLYLDPPYLHETRSVKNAYDHEMSKQDHQDLLDLLKGFEGRFLLSGYDSDLYIDNVGRYCWSTRKRVANNAGQNKIKQRRVEVLWGNYDI